MKQYLFIFYGIGSFSMILSGFFVAYFGFKENFGLVAMIMPILIALPSLIALKKLCNYKDFFYTLSSLSLFAFLIEIIGVLSGFPYGSFSYSNLVGYKLFNLVPINLPFAWVPLILAAYSLSISVIKHLPTLCMGRFKKISNPQKLNNHKLFLVILGIFFMLCFDLLLDPAAVKFGLWHYSEQGFYFGIPFSNFLGWILSSSMGILLVDYFLKRKSNFSLRISAIWMILFWTSVWIFKFFLPSSVTYIHSVYDLLFLFPALIGLFNCYLLLKVKD